jgi:DNA replication and repair protein RecF
VLVEAELTPGRTRVLVNRQRLVRSRDLLGVVRVSVFAPDDLALVKGGPTERRRFLDDLAVALQPSHDRLRREVERVVRQRTTLLKQAGGRLSDDVAFTLDVWDAKLVEAGEALGALRAAAVDDLDPLVAKAYEHLSGVPSAVRLAYQPPWRRSGLAEALAQSRADDVRRGVTGVGPHRDDLDLDLDGLVARTHASQGEQRSLALSLRLAAHQLVTDRVGEAPLLLLDDVLSELDPARATSLLAHLPPGQVVITTAGPLPPAARPDRVLRVHGGEVVS